MNRLTHGRSLWEFISAISFPHSVFLNKEGKLQGQNKGKIRTSILLGRILLSITLDHLDLQRKMAELKRANVMDKLSAIEAKLDELIHWMNERKSN